MPTLESIIRETAHRARIQNVRGEQVPAVNCTAFENEVCAEVLKLYPDAPFVACWHERADGTQLWRLRHRHSIEEFVEPFVDVEAIIAERDELQSEMVRRLVDAP